MSCGLVSTLIFSVCGARAWLKMSGGNCIILVLSLILPTILEMTLIFYFNPISIKRIMHLHSYFKRIDF